MWIYHIIGKCQSENYGMVKELKNKFSNNSTQTICFESNGFISYSIIFYFKDKSEEFVMGEIREKIDPVQSFIMIESKKLTEVK